MCVRWYKGCGRTFRVSLIKEGDTAMGGINHQPCNRHGTRYLAISTMMSREFTAGRSLFEAANVELEEVILAEVNQRNGADAYLECLKKLQMSEVHLAQTLARTHELEEEMQAKGYVPLPAFALYRDPSKMAALRADLVDAGLLKAGAFDTIFTPQLTNGFYGALAVLRDAIGQVETGVKELRTDMEATIGAANAGCIADMLETNQTGNFRLRFMQAYALWGKAFDLFLASAVFSTELWYQSTNAGSLLSQPGADQKAIA